MAKRLSPEDVFTPRAASVNQAMYMPRPQLEDALASALRRNLHIIIYGESGTGKSWLYKKVLADQKAKYLISNLANASRMGSITAELQNLIDRRERSEKTGHTEKKSAGLSVVVAKSQVSHNGQYSLGKMEPFEACLRMLRNDAGKRPAALVLDNLEAVFTKKKLLEELANLLILCDDERYAEYNVHIIIVGLPSGIKEYFYRTPHHQSVANRLIEIPEVSRLSHDEARNLLITGFETQLSYSCEDLGSILPHIVWVTDRVPLMLHEYGLELSLIAENSNRTITSSQLELADKEWMSKSLRHGYAIIESHLNERDTRVGRRNQTLYALGKVEGEQFKYSEVEKIIRRYFPTSTIGTKLNVPQMLSHLSTGDRPVVKRSPKGEAYCFADPRYRMVLRAMLVLTNAEQVEKRPLSR